MGRAMGRVAPIVLFGLIPVAFLLGALLVYWDIDEFAFDFHYGLYPQAHRLLSVGVPFDSPDAAITGHNAIYTTFTAAVATPITLLPPLVADVVFTALLVAAGAACLWVLGVRDWRVYGVVAMWAPVISAVQTANVTLVLALLMALAWKYRNRRFLPGVFVGLAIAVKLFPWPLVVWLAASRRYAAAAAALGVTVLSFLLILPFGSPLDYFRLMRRLGETFGPDTYSFYDPASPGMVAWVAAAVVVLGLIVYFGAVRGDDQASFTLGVVACLLLSPIVWLHYFSLLIVPLAIARPRLGPLWFLPLAYWGLAIAPSSSWELARATLITAVIVGTVVLQRSTRARPSRDPDLVG